MALTLNNNLKTLKVGDYFWCKYTVTTANTVGVFSDIATKTDAEATPVIPVASSNLPNGYFKYIVVDDYNGKIKLIADRNIQHSISWDVLNTNGIASGSGLPLLFNLIPTMTSNTSPSPYTITADSQQGSGYEAFRAFDKLNGASSNIWHSSSGTGGFNAIHWLQMQLDAPKIVSGYTITTRNDGQTQAPVDWKFQGSDDSLVWIDLDSQTNQPTGANIKTFYKLTSKEKYLYYRIYITKNNSSSGTGHVAIGEMELIENLPDKRFTTRLLTGGTVLTDKDNEWDKYITDSTLGGTITAGDNNVWNWSGVSTTTNTTPTSASYNVGSKVARGGSSGVTYWNPFMTTYVGVTQTGFRPVLEIESLFLLLNKSFISLSDGYKKFIQGTAEIPYSYKDVTNGKTYASDSNYASHYTSSAFDDNLGFNGTYNANGWMSNSTSNAWISVDLGVSKYIKRLSLAQYGYNGASFRCGDFRLEYSDDNSVWTTAISGKLLNKWEVQFFDVGSGSHRYWRVFILNSPANGAIGIAEMELMEEIVGFPATPSYWQTVSPTLPTLTQFQAEGMDNLSIFDRKIQKVLESPKVMNSEVLGIGKVYKSSIDLKKIFDLRKIEVK